MKKKLREKERERIGENERGKNGVPQDSLIFFWEHRMRELQAPFSTIAATVITRMRQLEKVRGKKVLIFKRNSKGGNFDVVLTANPSRSRAL